MSREYMNDSDRLDWIADALDCLREYKNYGDRMREIGKGFEPVGNKGHRIEDIIDALEQVIIHWD